MHLDQRQQFPAVLQQHRYSSLTNPHFQVARTVLPKCLGDASGQSQRHVTVCEIQHKRRFFFLFSSVGFFTTLASRRRGFGSQTLMDWTFDLAAGTARTPLVYRHS